MDGSKLLRRINAGEFEALDLGCGSGGSVEFVRKQFGYSRIAGIELDARKVELAREAGVEVLTADATSVPLAKGVVAACFLFHFLEHLRTLADAKAVLSQACRASREFVLIRQPFFGADEQLLEQGVKLAWSTWRTHANRMSTLDFHCLLSDLRAKGVLKEFFIGYAIPIASTEDSQVIPLNTGSEELYYDAEKHGPKPRIALSNVYREVYVVVQVADEIPLEKIEKVSRVARRVYPPA